MNNKKRHKSGVKKIARPFGILTGVLLVIVIVMIFRGKGEYEEILDNYYKVHENNDARLMCNSVIAQYWIDYTEKASGASYAMEFIEEELEDSIEHWDCGDKIKITYKIKSEIRASKEQLEELEENIYDWYAYFVYDRSDFSITDAYLLDIEFTIKGNEGAGNIHYPNGLLIIKENNEWRITRGTISCSFYDNQ